MSEPALQPAEVIDMKLQRLAQHHPDAPEIMQLMYIAKLGCDIGGCSKNKNYDAEQRMQAADHVVQLLLTEAHTDEILTRICKVLGSRANQAEPVQIWIPQRVQKHLNETGGEFRRINVLEAMYIKRLVQALNQRIEMGWKSPDGKLPNLVFGSWEQFKSPEESKMLLGVTKLKNRMLYGPFCRVFGQRKHAACCFEPGDCVWLADDHVQTGSALLARINPLIQRGVEVLGFSTLTGLPESRDLIIKPEIRAALEKAVRISAVLEGCSDTLAIRKLRGLLQQVGLDSDTLTNREALDLIALMLEPNREVILHSGEKIHTSVFFAEVLQKAGCNPALELGSDSLIEAFERPRTTLAELEAQLNTVIAKVQVRGAA